MHTHLTAMLWIATLHAFRGLRIVRKVFNDEWSDVMAKHATHGITQAAKQSALSYNQAESLITKTISKTGIAYA